MIQIPGCNASHVSCLVLEQLDVGVEEVTLSHVNLLGAQLSSRDQMKGSAAKQEAQFK